MSIFFLVPDCALTSPKFPSLAILAVTQNLIVPLKINDVVYLFPKNAGKPTKSKNGTFPCLSMLIICTNFIEHQTV